MLAGQHAGMRAGAGFAGVYERLDDADARTWVSLCQALAAIPGDPYGALVERYEEVTAVMFTEVGLPFYDRIFGAGRDLESLERAVASFAARRLPFRVDLNPCRADASTLEALAAYPLWPRSFQSNLFAPVRAVWRRPARIQPGIAVRPVEEHEVEGFSALYARAYGGGTEPARLIRFRRDSVAARQGAPGWELFVAEIGGRAVAGGLLFVADGVATLAGGATLPEERGRGCQQALIRARLARAAELGCELVVARCAVAGASQRNLERAGLRTAYTKLVWEADLRPRRRRGERAGSASARSPRLRALSA